MNKQQLEQFKNHLKEISNRGVWLAKEVAKIDPQYAGTCNRTAKRS